MKNYVIIGGGVASVGCIEGIRSVDSRAKITLIAAENRPVYCRPLISYYLQGKTDFEKMKYRPDSFYEENGCTLVYGKAESVDCHTKKVILQKRSIPYDSLCIATGSSPFIPPFEGLDTVDKKYGFMTADDAAALEKEITPDSKVLIVGAGLIGLKCAEGLSSRVANITVCDLAPHILSSILDEACAARMQKVLESNGISFLLCDTITSFDKHTAVMKSGKTVTFDILVLAIGVRANISLSQKAGCAADKGILIDNSMRTSLPDIFSAGDCTQGYDASTDSSRTLAIWPNAYMQGYCAGINMAGGESIFDLGMPMNAIGFFGLHALSAGSYDGDMHEEKNDSSIKRLYIRDGRLIGFMLIGDISKAGIYTSLIREKLPIKASITELLKKSPSLAILSIENRRKKLGGVV